VFRNEDETQFIPRSYVEIELQDEQRGTAEYTKASCYVIEYVGRHNLVLGREFIRKHSIRGGAPRGYTVYWA
jgi:hypothetical protein